MIANIALDYTEWAPPLYIDRVRSDIDTFTAQTDKYPSKIVLWVHQWDFLVKQAGPHLRPKYMLERVELDDFGLKATMRPAESSDGGELWGIKVEVRDPEAHKP